MLKILIPTTGISAFQETLRSLMVEHPKHIGRGADVMLAVCVNTPDHRDRSWARDLAGSAAVAGGWKDRILVVPDHVGYVEAMNLAWQVAEVQDDDYAVALNDDVVFKGDCLTPMLRRMDAYWLGVQVGPSVQHVGRDGLWGSGQERYRYCEGWFWMSSGGLLRRARRAHPENDPLDLHRRVPHLFDPGYAPAYCEDMDLSIRIQELGGQIEDMDLPVGHLRSQTYGNRREPFWTQNRLRLAQTWTL